MHDLEVLNGIFDIDDASWAMLEIHGIAFDQLFELLAAQIEGDAKVPGLAAVDVAVAMGFDAFAERRIAGNMPEFDQGLALKRGGKTTAVRILATLLPPDAGRARVAGFDVVRQAAALRAHIGLAGQYAAVDESPSGHENLEMVGRLYHMPRARRAVAPTSCSSAST